LAGFIERSFETLLLRRLGGFRGRRRDILTGINHGYLRVLIFKTFIRTVSSETETAGAKNRQFQEKKSFSFKKLKPPTNWGTEDIMLPPFVGFKKILQKSTRTDIPK